MPPDVVGARQAELARGPMCGPSVTDGVDHLNNLFGNPRGRGIQLAATALASALPEESLREIAPAYVTAFLAAYREDYPRGLRPSAR